ncbi:uncharacterized protein TrAtP1_003108 [Trichoderma atroviride]|uniref:uncharacterized protein n=1 Tax=Hypocrea atroviridis TaxID=63577 RepID=UPI00331C2538|nr:hypothetical protein TrAtP1_003108 [Trichoderma atroviride]
MLGVSRILDRPSNGSCLGEPMWFDGSEWSVSTQRHIRHQNKNCGHLEPQPQYQRQHAGGILRRLHGEWRALGKYDAAWRRKKGLEKLSPWGRGVNASSKYCSLEQETVSGGWRKRWTGQ